MSRLIPFLILSTSFVMPAAGIAQQPQLPDSPVGSWEGTLAVQNAEIPLVFHITQADDQLAATMDSPLQGAFGIPAGEVTFTDNVLTMEVPAIAGTYQGTLTDAGRIEGTWSQAAASFDLVLERVEDGEAGPNRPQHPEPPYPYTEEEVTFQNDAAGIELSGTLTVPEGDGPFAAAVLVTGSGPQDRDETLMGHKPFLVLADHLTREGIAVLRYDDRGVAESEGDFESATSFDFAGDAAAAVEFLRGHPAVDAGKIGIVGHSEGGLIAPLVATGLHGVPQKDLAFVVLLAGPGLPGGEILKLQSELITRASGGTDKQLADARDLQHRIQRLIRSEPDEEKRRDALREALTRAFAEMSQEELQAQGISPDQVDQVIDAQLNAISTDWFREFVMYDPRPALRQLRVPVLALNGTLDLQVPHEQNLREIGEALEEAGNPDFTLREMPGLNHLFQTAETGAPNEYFQIEETFAPAALQTIADWINERFR